MRKSSELTFTFLKIPFDYAAIILAAIVAYYIRFEQTVQDIRPVIFDLNFNKYLSIVIPLAFVWLIFFTWSGLYKFEKRKITDEIGKIILACSTGMTAVILYMFFVRELFNSRFIVLIAWILSILFVIITRAIIRKFQNTALSHGYGAHNIVVIGKNENTDLIISYFKKNPNLGYRVIKRFTDWNDEVKNEMLKLNKNKILDEIIQTDSSLARNKSTLLADFANENNLTFKFTAGQFEARTTNVEVHMIAGLPIVEIKKTKLDGWGRIIKRLIDFVFSSILIIIFSPIMFLIAIAIRLEDFGPAIYKNERVHKKGTFNVLKFRSMYKKFCTGKQFAKYSDQKAVLKYEEELAKKQSERKGPVYKILNDPRRTKVGRFIERTSLDELPQLFNVWTGSLSLVGPRPHQPREVEKYEKHHKRVLDIKPGVSGLAQISGRSDLDFDEEVKLDTYYIENWSLKQDFWIMLKTPWIILKRKSKV
ncbi:sugar transferase [Candidatus Falkowbacteria bacterium]|jgi:exopolysaccharide biosynthesis polyprenyl glycosylphosphotransferase|nr:sugar transferase [Candidatus Falkowbacteria bacterium]MBT7007291.1 sugar transferase [Candidatus Falkowbacteria bacterium]